MRMEQEKQNTQEQLEIQAQVAEVASQLHEDWRVTRLQEDGSYEPREKTTTDANWIEAHGTDTVDIANSTYDQLPEDWKAENKAAADVAVGLYREGVGTGDTTSDAFVEGASSAIHDAWLERNTWAKDGELDVPYDQLPEDEKAKDRVQILTTIEKLGQY